MQNEGRFVSCHHLLNSQLSTSFLSTQTASNQARSTSTTPSAASREEREARGRQYAEVDIAAPHAGDTSAKATGRRAVAEARRMLAGRPSRTYLVVAALTGALGLMASVWPRMVR